MSRLVNDSNVVSIHPRLRKERFVVSNTKQISADYSLMLMFIYLKREALNTRGGSIEARTVCLLMVFLRATIELTWSGIEREGRCHGLFNLHQNPIKPRSPRYAKRETANVNILNNLSFASRFSKSKIAETPSFAMIDRMDRFLLSAPRAIMGILTIFSQPPTGGIELIAFLYFAFAARACPGGSMVTSEQDKRRKIEIVLFYSIRRRRTEDASLLCTEESFVPFLDEIKHFKRINACIVYVLTNF